MTRKNYRYLAQAYYGVLMRLDSPEGVEAWLDMVWASARVLAQDNERFSYEVFWRACGVHEAVGESQLAYMLNGNTPREARVMA